MSDILDFPGGGSSEVARHLARSTRYRMKASHLARAMENETDEAKMQSMLQLALSWIQLAENEEWLSGLHRD